MKNSVVMLNVMYFIVMLNKQNIMKFFEKFCQIKVICNYFGTIFAHTHTHTHTHTHIAKD
jgi:hypothetical protein